VNVLSASSCLFTLMLSALFPATPTDTPTVTKAGRPWELTVEVFSYHGMGLVISFHVRVFVLMESFNFFILKNS
jgi:hypothetical protein